MGSQEHVSFEMASINKMIRFYVWTPRHLRNFVEGQIYAPYQQCRYTKPKKITPDDILHSVVNTAELTLVDNEVLPIKTFTNFEVDPLAGITATLAKLEDEDEELWIQVIAAQSLMIGTNAPVVTSSKSKGGSVGIAVVVA